MKKIPLFTIVVLFTLLTAAACGRTATTTNTSTTNATDSTFFVNATTDTNSTVPSNASQTVSVKDGSFDPPSLTVVKNTTVVFRNDGSSDHYVASDPHPIHNGLPGFDLGTLAPGDSAEFTFVAAGRFGYHDHIYSSVTGTIIVTD